MKRDLLKKRWTTFHELEFIRKMASAGRVEVLQALLSHVWTRNYGEVDRRDVYHELRMQLGMKRVRRGGKGKAGGGNLVGPRGTPEFETVGMGRP